VSENGAGQNREKTKRRPARARRSWRGVAHHHAEASGSVEELAARLAPLEEQASARASDDGRGAIIVGAEKLKLPEGIGAGQSKGAKLFGVEPVAVVIVALLAAFILFVAWEISQMPLTNN
jgi:hypothetical protein